MRRIRGSLLAIAISTAGLCGAACASMGEENALRAAEQCSSRPRRRVRPDLENDCKLD